MIMPIIKNIKMNADIVFLPVVNTIQQNGTVYLSSDFNGKEVFALIFDNGNDRFDVDFKDVHTLRKMRPVKRGLCYAESALFGRKVKGAVVC